MSPERRAVLDAAKERITQLLERGQSEDALPQLEQLVLDYPARPVLAR